MNSISSGRDRVWSFLRAHPGEVAYLTAREVGERCGVSESTVIRAVQARGYPGFPAFQREVRADLAARRSALERLTLAPGRDPLSRAFGRDIKNLQATWHGLEPEAFARAADLVAAARRVWVLGLRMSHSTAVVLELGLSFLGVNARLLATRSGEPWDAVARVVRGDVLIAVSFPRYTRLAVEATEHARRVGARVVAITDGPGSPLAEGAEVVLPVAYGIDGYVESFTASISLAQALLLAVAERAGPRGRTALEEREALWARQRVYWKPGRNGPTEKGEGAWTP